MILTDAAFFSSLLKKLQMAASLLGIYTLWKICLFANIKKYPKLFCLLMTHTKSIGLSMTFYNLRYWWIKQVAATFLVIVNLVSELRL